MTLTKSEIVSLHEFKMEAKLKDVWQILNTSIYLISFPKKELPGYFTKKELYCRYITRNNLKISVGTFSQQF